MTGTPLESLIVPAALAGERVDRAVALLTGWSRAEVQVLIDAGSVLVDGKSVIKSRRLVEGDVVDLLAEPEPVGVPQAQDIPIVVVHEDADVIVVDKPAGLIVHPGAGHPDGTLGERPAAAVSRAGGRRGSVPAGDRAPARRRTRAACSRSPAPRLRTTRSSTRWPPARSSAATSRWCGASRTRRAD